MILNEIGVIGNGSNPYCKANESSDKIIHANTDYTNRFGFEISEYKKKKH